ncbi:hypothetical protein ES703_113473 [subsurface metagenome]
MASKPTLLTIPTSFIPREELMIKAKKAPQVVRPPVNMPLPLFKKVSSMDLLIGFPMERLSVKMEMIWMEKSIPNPMRITVTIEVIMFKLLTRMAAKPIAQISPTAKLRMAKRGAAHIRKERMSKIKIAIKAMILV